MLCLSLRDWIVSCVFLCLGGRRACSGIMASLEHFAHRDQSGAAELFQGKMK